MIAREQTAVRNVGLLLMLRGLLVAGGVVVAAVVPRLMGPTGYGQVALLVALSFWFTLAASLGFTEVMGRHVPHFGQTGDEHGLRAFFGRLLSIRLLAGLLAGGLYLVVTTTWLRDLDAVAMAVLAAVVFVRAPAGLFFSLYLGLNQAARWGVADILRQWGTLAFMLPGYLLGGLRGAALGVLLAELVVLLVGLIGVRPYLSRAAFRIDLHGMAPYLRFGLIFYASDLVLAAFERSGEALVRAMCGDYAQVGFFGVGYSVYLIGAVGLPQIALAFAPLLTVLRLEGDRAAVRLWIERLLKWLALGSMTMVLGAVLVGGDLVPLVLGGAYRPVAANLIPLAIGLVALSLTSVANLSALTHDRPAVALVAAVLRLATFWLLGLFFVGGWGSWGASLAVLGAVAAQAGFFTWRMRRVVGYSLRRWLWVVGLGTIFLPLGLLRSSPAVNAALFGVFVVGYGGLLFLLRLVTLDELGVMWRAVRRPGLAASDGEVS
ncbi:MAG TPA: oligosaccharide flippase family protein [Polyangia bacterium]|jgi:Membrane protein involved in the export of O-antigen and teichoic acid|nr:oligosaccharide flippase family protein [Polyangia bacterium]